MNLRWILPVSLLIGLDQASKFWVETSLPLHAKIDLIPTLSLFRTYNEGVAFSALSGFGKWPLIILTFTIILFVLWLWRNLIPGRKISEWGYCLVISGAIGNLIDRVQLGKVVDMIFFHIDSLQFEFAVFNLADTFITLGAAAIVLDEIISWRAERSISRTQDRASKD